MQSDLKNHQKRARFVQSKVSEAKKRHVKVDHVVEMLAEQLFVSRATIYRDMRYSLETADRKPGTGNWKPQTAGKKETVIQP